MGPSERPLRDKEGATKTEALREMERAEEKGRKPRLIGGRMGVKAETSELERQHKLVSRKEEAGKNEDDGLKGTGICWGCEGPVAGKSSESFEKLMGVGLASGSEEPGSRGD